MSVGILVSPNEEGEPVLDSWKMSTKFEEFMHTKGTLEIMEDNVEASATPERSIIRLLKKAQELNMDYTLPNSEWMESLHGDVILPYYKNDLDSLKQYTRMSSTVALTWFQSMMVNSLCML